MSNKLIVVTAPSGAGKSSICRRVLKAMPALRFSVSATTRPRRECEVDGEHYRFLTREAFMQAVAEDRFIEYEEVYPGRLYGTLKEDVESKLRHHHLLLDIDVKGARQVKESFGNRAFVIFVRPPSIDELRRRLVERGTETVESIEIRMRRAEEELSFEALFDASVVNRDLDEAAEETIALISSFIDVQAEKGPSPGPELR